MKLAVCTEDSSDAEILRELITRVIGRNVVAFERQFRFERGGWNKALQLAPLMARAVHRSDADGAVFAIDNDEAEPLHTAAHQLEPAEGCRHCELVRQANVTEVLAWSRPGLPALRFFFVVPVRAMETWLLLAREPQFKGDPLSLGRTASERRELKRRAYGTDLPDQRLIVETGSRIVKAMNVDDLAARSPSFRSFRDTLLSH